MLLGFPTFHGSGASLSPQAAHKSPHPPFHHSTTHSTLAQRIPSLWGLPSLRHLAGHRQARFSSLTWASLLVIMVAKTSPKRTLLIRT